VDVHNFLVEREVPHEVFPTPGRLATAESLAAVLGLPPGEVGKVVVFEGEGDRGGIAAVVPSGSTARPGPVREATGRPDLKPAADDRVAALTDFLPGTVPPAGLPSDVTVVVDRSLDREDVLYFLGGEPRIVLKIRGTDLVRATAATVAPIASSARGRGTRSP
jgi:prolyl-tRNA editing enzyme YbaK/EbsC (Cys-tRNA(Pro) deacylase)